MSTPTHIHYVRPTEFLLGKQMKTKLIIKYQPTPTNRCSNPWEKHLPGQRDPTQTRFGWAGSRSVEGLTGQVEYATDFS